MRVLHIASECFPLAKTGGLADVVGALPAALAAAGDDVRVLLPAYRGTADRLEDVRRHAPLTVRDQSFALLEGRLPASGLRIWLLDRPNLYARAGDPYHDGEGRPHADNAWRFGCFAEAAARLAQAGVEGWKPDIAHAHDWQAALVPAWLSLQPSRPSTVLTIHNLAYQGCFGHHEFAALGLPDAWWHVDIGEFWGGFSFLKAGIATADALTTVSPHYAQEILTPEFGQGLDDRLRLHADKLQGILNGIDTALWNPVTDPHLPARFDDRSVTAGKAINKAALQAQMGLQPDAGVLLLGMVTRFAGQKGIDAVLDALPALLSMPVQLVVLGAGEAALEAGFSDWARRHPQQLALRLGHDETLAHRIEAAADAFLMPSRFEPCGLNQMYSQRYGCVPLVRRVGGLVDTVTALDAPGATGILFDHSDANGVRYAVEQALSVFGTARWAALQRNGMSRDFSWNLSAQQYQALYARLQSQPVQPWRLLKT